LLARLFFLRRVGGRVNAWREWRGMASGGDWHQVALNRS
jgi:hypothetical protein